MYTLLISDFGGATMGYMPDSVLLSLGTPLYTAPEIFIKGQTDFTNKADIFSVGVVLGGINLIYFFRNDKEKEIFQCEIY